MHRSSLLTAVTAAAALAFAAPALATAPANDDLADATMIAGSDAPAPKSFELASAGLEAGETWSGSTGETVWFKWKPYATGASYASVCDGPGDVHRSRVWRLPAGKAPTHANLVAVALLPAYNPAKSTPCLPRFKAIEDTDYYIQVGRMPGGGSDHALEIAQDTVSPPKPVIASPGDVSAPAVTIDFTVSDDTFGATCSLDDANPIECPPGTVLGPVLGGAHNLSVRAYDAMGNMSSLAFRDFTVDPSLAKTATPNAPAGPANPVLPAGGDVKPPAVTSPAPPVVDPRAALVAPCTLSLKAPKQVSRKALRKGLRKGVRVAVKTTGGCTAKVALKRRGNRVTVVATAGTLKRTATVKVR